MKKFLLLFILIIPFVVSCEKEKDANIPYALVYTEETTYGTFEYRIRFMGSEHCTYTYSEYVDGNDKLMKYHLRVKRVNNYWSSYGFTVESMHPLHFVRFEKIEPKNEVKEE